MPFGEVLAHTRHLTRNATNYPHRDFDRLRTAAEVAILLPPGYNLGHVWMGRGILWGVGELNLERRNREGVTYRDVMGNFFTEIERCLRMGVAFDLLWDLPGMELPGYREVVRVREDGKVAVIQADGQSVHNGARTPPRPAGKPPELHLTLEDHEEKAPCALHVQAHVVEGDAPVWYAPAPDKEGVHHNERVAWGLYGPGEEDYQWRTPVIVTEPARPHAEGGHIVAATVRIAKPGTYRLRAATTDLAGRSAVVWKEITVSP